MVGTKESAAKAKITKEENVRTYERITGLPVGARVKIGTTPGGHFNGRTGVVDNHNMGEVGVEIGGRVYYYRPSEVTKL
jgi:hypothetical protein